MTEQLSQSHLHQSDTMNFMLKSGGTVVKNLPEMWETWVQSLDWEDSLEKGKATDSSILA